MSQPFSRIKTASFAFIFVFVSAFSSFGQTENLQNDLENSFVKYDLIKVNNQTARKRAATENRLSISTADKNFDLVLTPRDLRAANYRAEDTNGAAVNRLESGEVTTFSGKIAGEADSEVRMSIGAGKTEGYFVSGGEMFMVESAQKYSRAAASEDYVVYKSKDSINRQAFFCERSIGEKIEQGREMLLVGGVQSPQAFSVIEMATEADFEFVGALGGAASANREILDILNMVEGVYQKELNLKISVVYQHTWTTQDPFLNTNTLNLLTSFKDYWNANLPAAQYPRDATHLFSGKPTVTGQGLAYIGVVCKSPASAYSLTGRIDFAPVKFQLTAHEVAHNLGGRHAEAAQQSVNTLMNATLTPTTLFSFSDYSRNEITTFTTANSGCLSVEEVAAARIKFDYDGDGKADISLFRPSDRVWYVLNSASGVSYSQFGLATDKIVPADYDGDGKTDIAVFRPETGVWFITKSSGGFQFVQFGAAEDVPMPADFDGNGKAEAAVYRPSTGVWFILNTETLVSTATQFGAREDLPVTADYNGDGKSEIAVYRPSLGVWFTLNQTTGQTIATRFGVASDKPVPADYDGDGKTDIAVFRPSDGNWYILPSTGGFTVTKFGLATDTPTPADYDGDGKTDIAVYRPSDGNWYQLQSRLGFNAIKFGISADQPTPSAFVR